MGAAKCVAISIFLQEGPRSNRLTRGTQRSSPDSHLQWLRVSLQGTGFFFYNSPHRASENFQAWLLYSRHSILGKQNRKHPPQPPAPCPSENPAPSAPPSKKRGSPRGCRLDLPAAGRRSRRTRPARRGGRCAPAPAGVYPPNHELRFRAATVTSGKESGLVW